MENTKYRHGLFRLLQVYSMYSGITIDENKYGALFQEQSTSTVSKRFLYSVYYFTLIFNTIKLILNTGQDTNDVRVTSLSRFESCHI